MKIAPIDITHKTFNRKMFGLDSEEVQDFLRLVASELEGVIRDRNELRELLRDKELSIAEYKDRDELLKSTITTATKMADKIRADSERESKIILGDANQKAEMIVRDARDSLRKIYQEITDLKNVRMQFENNIKALVHSHMSLIEQGNRMMPTPQLQNTMNVTYPSQDAPAVAPHAPQQSQHHNLQNGSSHQSKVASDQEEERAIRNRVSEAVGRAML